MSDAKIVRAKLRRLLESGTLDMDTATQRSIQRQLEDDLGLKLDGFKPLIKEEIDRFLMEQDDEDVDGGGDEDYGEEEEEEAKEPAKKKQRAASGGAAAAPGCGDSGRGSDSGPAGGHLLKLSDKRYVTLSQFKGKCGIDIREYYVKDGALAPTQKGLYMSPEQWRLLTAGMESLSAALDEKNDSVSIDLGGGRRAGPSNYGGRSTLDLREFYEKDGEQRPGKKGIALPADQWRALVETSPDITEALRGKLGGAWPTAPAAAAGAAAGTTAAGGKETERSQPAEASAQGSSCSGGGGAVELSRSRRADVSCFQGKHYVNIREYYEKGGQMLPGKKGISLPLDQFSKLAAAGSALQEALQSRNTEFEVQLSNKRKASISCFKGTYYVNVREYYEKGGEMLPGAKGISLPQDQWNKLEPELGRLQQQLEAAAGGGQ